MISGSDRHIKTRTSQKFVLLVLGKQKVQWAKTATDNTNCNYSVVINKVACVAGGIRGEEDFTLPQNPLKIWKTSDTIWKICQNLNAPLSK
jgi:hypothetical protein